ncbi:hypothetical protein ACSSNL_13480 [Thalassobius sp. S69A]|uniref:hypothetical protein n=1 Tax=unclassified Thalassovita TaxID=2619711 RepID=UPI000C3D7503|nr:hypothetical protein [Paracoccaceae bacterium]
MQDDPKNNLPGEPGRDPNSSTNGRALYVKDLHYHATSLTELRRLAETNPDLAEKVVDQEDRRHQREDSSFKLALIVTGFLATLMLTAFVSIAYLFGLFQSIGMIVFLLAVSHLLRVVLTGEWSETSWLGQFLSSGKSGKKTDDED